MSLRITPNTIAVMAFASCLSCSRDPQVPGDNAEIGSLSAALTAEQCTYFEVAGKVTICHATNSVKHPFVVIRTSEQGCINGHANHPLDYIAIGDPNCQGLGCLPAGAPCDGTLDCCEGTACVDSTCTENEPTCTDGGQNGEETDIDCGGPTCPPCAIGQQCTGSGDCASGYCGAGTCSEEPCPIALLAHFDGEDGSQSFAEQTGKTLQPYGRVSISTTESVFGGGSAYFEGAGYSPTGPNDIGASLYAAPSPDFGFGDQDFTIEFWLRLTDLFDEQPFLASENYGGATAHWTIRQRNNGGQWQFSPWSPSDGNDPYPSASWGPDVNRWYHIAVVRSGAIATTYADGVPVVSQGAAGPIGFGESNGVWVGRHNLLAAYGPLSLHGYMDELRISRCARYTSAFTPPTEPFANP